MTTNSLAAMRAAFGDESKRSNENAEPTNNDMYPFWNMKAGQRCVVRFLPDANTSNPRMFLEEKVTHTLTVNGKPRTVPCLSMYEEDCPICKVSQDYYKAEDKVNGKKYWKKRQYLARVIVVEDPLPANTDTGEKFEGKVCTISLGFQIYNIIKEAFADPDVFDAPPQSLTEGYDFIIKKTEQGEYSSYATGTKFSAKQRPLSEEEMGSALDSSVALNTLLPRNPGVDRVTAMLNADLNGGDADQEQPAARPAKEAPAKQASSASAPAPEASDEAPAGGEPSDVEAMIAAIKARRMAKNAG